MSAPAVITDDFVLINDVGPRDGLQNQAQILTADQRLLLINSLVESGLKAVEIGSFVSPKAVPAMAGTDEIAKQLTGDDVYYSALIPNQKGYELAVAAGVRAVSIVVAASETMNQENIKRSTVEAMSACGDIVSRADADGVDALGCIATAWECPFEGITDPTAVLTVAKQMKEQGVKEIVLADTIGAANPNSVKRLLALHEDELGLEGVSCHFHDTRGMALANVAAALEVGVRKFDASIGGLGGCPFAPGATGNVATEDVVLMLNQMGCQTHVDLNGLLKSIELAIELTGNCDGGHSYRWLLRQQEKGLL